MDRYSIEYQYEIGINWYFLDRNDCIVHFNSAGAIVPDIITANAADNEVLNEYFAALSPYTSPVVNPFLTHYFDFTKLLTPPEPYVGYYASRGLIDFDKQHPCSGSHDIAYFQVAVPTAPLTLQDVPDAIKNRLLKVRQPIRFHDFYQINADYGPWATLFTNCF